MGHWRFGISTPTFLNLHVTSVHDVVIGFLKFRRLTSYHTKAATLGAYLVGGATVVIFAGGPAWPFRLATVAIVYAELEEIAITCALPRWRANVPTLGRALALRRSIQAPTTSSAPG